MEAVRAWKKTKQFADARGSCEGVGLGPGPAPAGRALSKATSDTDWVVRAAAIQAIAKRGDPTLLPDVSQAMSDKKDIVRFSAAAAVLHLTCIAEEKKAEAMDERGTDAHERLFSSERKGGQNR